MSQLLMLMPPPAAAPKPKAKSKAKAKSKSKDAATAKDATIAWWSRYWVPKTPASHALSDTGSTAMPTESLDATTLVLGAAAQPTDVGNLSDFDDHEVQDVSSEAAACSEAPSVEGREATEVAAAVAPAAQRAEVATAEALSPGEVFVWAAPDVKNEPSNPTCYRCKQEVEVLRAPLVGKSHGSWKCDKCNTRGTQLNRLFGSWPPASFKKLDSSVQAKFWQDAKEKACKDQLEELFVQTLTTSRIEQEVAQVGGEYLPLSVYEARGFDIKRIEAHCKDTEDHKVLGTCYRVDIRGGYSKTIEQLARAEVNELKAKAKAPHQKQPAPDDSNSSDSDDSVSGKKHKKGKNDKKKKKDKKATRAKNDKKDKRGKKDNKDTKSKKRAKASDSDSDSKPTSGSEEDDKREKAHLKKLEQEKNKLAKKNVGLATRVLCKIERPKISLERDLGDKMAIHVPKYGIEPAKKRLKELEKVHALFKKIHAERGMGEVTYSVDEVDALVKQALEAAALLSKLLATAKSNVPSAAAA